ncbi:MAG: VanW family protein [Clostridiales bacterium]|jgi:vancomycin resistance protein YoaR|nr:VanW family protein [Clostridiales bacterium]
MMKKRLILAACFILPLYLQFAVHALANEAALEPPLPAEAATGEAIAEPVLEAAVPAEEIPAAEVPLEAIPIEIPAAEVPLEEIPIEIPAVEIPPEEIPSEIPAAEIPLEEILTEEALAASDILSAQRQFGANVTLDGIPLADYTYPLAYLIFSQAQQKCIQEFQVKLTVSDKTFVLNTSDIDYSADTLETLQKIWRGELPGDQNYNSKHSYNTEKIDQFLQNAYKEANIVSASSADNGVVGYTLDKNAFRSQVLKAIDQAVANSGNHQASVKAAVEKVSVKAAPEPVPSSAPSESMGDLLGKYSTKTTTAANRNTNIRLATKAISGVLVKPGQNFSFNQTIGNTTAAKGYTVAPIYVNGKVSTGIGGGICQVSSTLYNAVLNAGMKVVERHPHSLPVSYVPKGKDATVSYPGVDFRFQNTTKNNLYVTASFEGYTLTVSLYGKK